MGSCSRTEILIGQIGLAKLAESHVLIAGLGGVGGVCAESLCRAGIGGLTIVDFDTVSETDLNRQIIALHSTMGQAKTEVMAKRLKDINPNLELVIKHEFIDADKAHTIATEPEYDFVADCIDAIKYKTILIDECLKHDKPIISSMGAGGRLDPTQVIITTLNKTEYCALSREMRKNLRRLGASLKFPVVYSKERPIKALGHEVGKIRAVNGAISYLPNIFGLMMAGFIIQRILT